MKQEQFKKEVLPLRSQLFRYAERLLENVEDAEDIIQEVFLKLWYMRNDLEQYNSLPALSVQITKHLCLNRLKVRQRTTGNTEHFLWLADTYDPSRELEEKDKLEKVMRIIDQLPGLQQTVLRMKHVDGFEVEEIAELTGSTPEAIRMNLSRARKRVKELYSKIEVS